MTQPTTLHPEWQAFLQAQGAVLAPDQAAVLHFGHPAAEQAARQAESATVLASLDQLGLIGCTGDDADEFLHNQLTQDIRHLGAEAARHAAWCTAKGRMLASFVAYRQEGGLHLTLAAELVPATLKRLQMFVLRAKVSLADLSATHVVLGLAGPQAEAVLNAAGLPFSDEPMGLARSTQATVIRIGDNRFHIVVLAAAAPALWQALAARAQPVGLPVWQGIEIDAGYPLVTAATREAFVPQMADFDQLGGVSFNKGCYPGQEVVARTKYLGKVKRHLFRLHGPVPLQAGEELFAPDCDQDAGRVVCAAPCADGGWSALAVVLVAHAAQLHARDRNGPLLSAAAVYPDALA